jgi:hypothetical protein
VPAQHVAHVSRQGAAGAEQVDLEDQRAQIVFLLEQILQRRVRDDTAIPVVFTIDLNCRQRRR